MNSQEFRCVDEPLFTAYECACGALQVPEYARAVIEPSFVAVKKSSHLPLKKFMWVACMCACPPIRDHVRSTSVLGPERAQEWIDVTLMLFKWLLGERHHVESSKFQRKPRKSKARRGGHATGGEPGGGEPGLHTLRGGDNPTNEYQSTVNNSLLGLPPHEVARHLDSDSGPDFFSRDVPFESFLAYILSDYVERYHRACAERPPSGRAGPC